jgi:hypothetical protein
MSRRMGRETPSPAHRTTLKFRRLLLEHRTVSEV